MLGLLLIYFIGKYFYDLAIKFNKKPWPYTILGIVVYYGGILLFGVLLGVVAAMIGREDWLDTSEFVLGIIALPFGIFCCWLLYIFLRKTWVAADANIETEIDEFGNRDIDDNFEKKSY